MKKQLAIITLFCIALHARAQTISPGGLYGASGSSSVNGVSVNWVLGNLNAFADISPLPVRLIHFEGKLNAAGLAELHWKTAEEVNNLGFEIQKSADGKKWELLGWVDGAANSAAEHSYQYTDTEFSTTSYYRLRQVDFDDSYSYSKIICVIAANESLDRFIVFPNPAHEQKVKVKMPEKTQRLMLIDELGRELKRFEWPGTEQEMTLPHTGSFLLQIETPVGSKTTKVIFY